MNTLTTDCLEIIERLPAGAKLELFQIDWDEYEQLLSQMGELSRPPSELRLREASHCGAISRT